MPSFGRQKYHSSTSWSFTPASSRPPKPNPQLIPIYSSPVDEKCHFQTASLDTDKDVFYQTIQKKEDRKPLAERSNFQKQNDAAIKKSKGSKKNTKRTSTVYLSNPSCSNLKFDEESSSQKLSKNLETAPQTSGDRKSRKDRFELLAKFKSSM